MRFGLAMALVACGGSPPPELPRSGSGSGSGSGSEARPARRAFEPIDLFTALGSPATADDATTFIAPLPLQLELGGSVFDSAATAPLPVKLVERAGKKTRVAIRLDNVRFGAWIDDRGVLAVVVRESPVAEFAGGGSRDFATGPDPMEVVLRSGAHVRRLAHAHGWTQVRYSGALEVNGWLPDTALADELPPHHHHGRIPTGAPQLMLLPGTIFRAKPDWAGRELALLANGYIVDLVKSIDRAWDEVAYADDEVRLHAVVAKFAPPGRVHRPHEREAAQPIVPDATAPSGTCLYARAGGEPIGFVDGDRPVQLVETGQPGWWSLVVDTPWDAIGFVANGPARDALVTCAPSVP